MDDKSRFAAVIHEANDLPTPVEEIMAELRSLVGKHVADMINELNTMANNTLISSADEISDELYEIITGDKRYEK